ncbi:hypothetical protein L9F63_017394, partial [Diploptera punctata]
VNLTSLFNNLSHYGRNSLCKLPRQFRSEKAGSFTYLNSLKKLLNSMKNMFQRRIMDQFGSNLPSEVEMEKLKIVVHEFKSNSSKRLSLRKLLSFRVYWYVRRALETKNRTKANIDLENLSQGKKEDCQYVIRDICSIEISCEFVIIICNIFTLIVDSVTYSMEMASCFISTFRYESANFENRGE